LTVVDKVILSKPLATAGVGIRTDIGALAYSLFLLR
jgi:hypothetical protein